MDPNTLKLVRSDDPGVQSTAAPTATTTVTNAAAPAAVVPVVFFADVASAVTVLDVVRVVFGSLEEDVDVDIVVAVVVVVDVRMFPRDDGSCRLSFPVLLSFLSPCDGVGGSVCRFDR